ncbi:hypothetical protein [Glaciecola sp. MF2-115]|uniref:hypothetical protein n=1 Tax=Glaciecola sp. MF2-115 TaxID=3384827 RepID=UPI0039A26D5F
MALVFIGLPLLFSYSVGWFILSIPRILFKQPRIAAKRITTFSLLFSIALALGLSIPLDGGFLSAVIYFTVMVVIFNVLQLLGLYFYQMATGK